MFDIETFENFLEKDYFEEIQSTLLGDNFPWYFNYFKTTGIDDLLNFQFVHNFYRNYTASSQYFSMLDGMINKIEPVSLLHIKANLNPVTEKNYQHEWHSDFPGHALSLNRTIRYETLPSYTGLLYVNSNDGGTEFEDGSFIKSESNKMIIFHSSIKHRSINCTDSKVRCVLNINFIKEK